MENNETKKLVVITLVAVLVLNLLSHESKKNFEKSVLNILKNNPTAVEAVNPPAVPPPPPAPPSEEEQLKQQLADKINVDLGNTPILGNRNAKIMIVVFSDSSVHFQNVEQIHFMRLNKNMEMI